MRCLFEHLLIMTHVKKNETNTQYQLLLGIIKRSAHIIHGKISQTAATVLTCVLMHCK